MKSRSSIIGLRVLALAAAVTAAVIAGIWTPAPVSVPVAHAVAPSLSIDLEPNTPGIQSTSTVPPNSFFCAAIVFENPSTDVSGLTFEVVYDQTKLLAPTIGGPPLTDRNPDLNDSTAASACTGVTQDGFLAGPPWDCSPGGGPTGDNNGNPSIGTAFIACLDLTFAGTAGAGTGVVAYIDFDTKAAAGPATLTLQNAQFLDASTAETGSCNPVLSVAMTCNNATVTLDGPYKVVSTGDEPDATPGDNVCASTGVGNLCTLRAAIEESNAHPPDDDAIHFSIGFGLATITPLSPLPMITDPVSIDGRTQPGFVSGGGPIVEIRGDSAGGGAHGLYVTAGDSLIAGLVINRFATGIELWLGGNNTLYTNHVGTSFASATDLGNTGNGLVINESANNTIGSTVFALADYNVFSGNGSNGIYIVGAGSTGNTIMTNAVGTNAGPGNLDVGNDGHGLLIDGASSTTVEFNVFSGNGSFGISMSSTASGNIIRRSTIGTDRFVGFAIPNVSGGIQIEGPNNIIGAFNNGNFISGNTGDGLLISGAAAAGNIAFHNIIGLNFTGTGAIANTGNGVTIKLGAHDNTIGSGALTPSGNIISGNTGDGIEICCTAATARNVIVGNAIGTGLGVLTDFGNGLNGIDIASAESTRVGASAAASRNFISGNGGSGIFVSGPAVGTQILGNYIGLGIDGSTALGNSGPGVWLPNATDALIGGSGPGRNVISANGQDGIRLGASSTGSRIRNNYIGTDASGMLDRGNTDHGVVVIGDGHTIGGSTAGDRNIISGNGGRGIWINIGDGNLVDNNYIGTAADGATLLGNLNGVLVLGSGQSANDINRNVIAGSTIEGVIIDGATSNDNAVRNNRIFSNGAAAISLTGGANSGIAAPSITGIIVGVLTGTACALCAVDIFSDTASQARTYEGTTFADDNGDGSGDWTFTGEVSGPRVTATATNVNGTSMLSTPLDIVIAELTGTGVAGYDSGDDNGPAATAQVNGPRGIFRTVNGTIYLADTGNNRIRTIAADATRTINTIAGSGAINTCEAFAGDGGQANVAKLCAPRDVFVAPDGTVYIADTGNCRVRKVDTGGVITTVAGTVTCGYNADNIGADTAQLDSPSGVALDAAGNLYIADTGNDRVRKVDTGGTITTVAGGNGAGSAGDGGLATNAQLDQPRDVYIALGVDLMIADTGNNRIRRVRLSAGRITTLAGTGTAGSLGDGGLARLAQLNAPEAIAADTNGNLFIADTLNNKIRRVQTDGNGAFGPNSIITTLTGADAPGDVVGAALTARFSGPAGIAVGLPTGGGGGGEGGGADAGVNTGAVAIGDTLNNDVDEGHVLGADDEPDTDARGVTSCVGGSVVTADFFLIGLVPLGMVAARKRGRWLFSLLLSLFRRRAPQPA